MDANAITKALEMGKNAGYVLIQIKVCPKRGEVLEIVDGNLVITCKSGTQIVLTPEQVHGFQYLEGQLTFDRNTRTVASDMGLGPKPAKE